MGVVFFRRNCITHKIVPPRRCPSWLNPARAWCSWLANSTSPNDKTGWIQVLQIHPQLFSSVRQFCLQWKKYVALVSSKHTWTKEQQHRCSKGIHLKFFKIEPHEKSCDTDGSCPVLNRFRCLHRVVVPYLVGLATAGPIFHKKTAGNWTCVSLKYTYFVVLGSTKIFL